MMGEGRNPWRRLIVAGLLGVWLWGIAACSPLRGEVPVGVVTEAVVQQVAASQNRLWQQLNGNPQQQAIASIRYVRVKHLQRVTVADTLAYEVTGTYQATWRYRDRRRPIIQNAVPFSVILRPIPETDIWQWLDLPTASSRDQPWHWENVAWTPPVSEPPTVEVPTPEALPLDTPS